MRTKKRGIVLVTVLAVLFLSSIALAVDCPIPDTGQTKCYDDEGEIPCPQPGEPFYGQDAHFGNNLHSYTKLDAYGNDLPDTAPSWVVVRDNATGLIWEVKTDDSSIHDKDTMYNWDDAVLYCEDLSLGGFADWRIPTVIELSCLIAREKYDPSINSTYFPNTVSEDYWSSTASASVLGYVWHVDFYDGSTSLIGKSYGGRSHVRAVRGGQCGLFNNFIDHGDGTVSNTDTGLMWQKNTAPGTFNWQQALSYCESLTLAEYDDWRLPNVNELQSLVDYSRYNPSINTGFFPDTVSSTDIPSPNYWSSTTNVYDNEYVWEVSFSTGGLDNSGYKSGHDYVRAVRGGVTESSTTTTISGSTTTTTQSCPIEEIYGVYSEETEILRYLRDNVLSQTPEGQEIIRLYYELSPVIAKAMKEDVAFKAQVKGMIDGVVRVIK
jgi:hypothetical protein